ncbi:hypothetical protein IWQ62_003141 [Dispira parvispora]|uniref:DM2 domain-containing protein n=1 Tax=Dispira parvispora TaxID=1520584 RepID=A0A9W8E7B7_9FUNG|nr:hypothetical protein IWQ62_003141 [Dispira parvispora]
MSLDLHQFIPRINEILGASNLDGITAGNVRRQLEQEKGLDLSSVKKELKQLIMDCYQKALADQAPIPSPVEPPSAGGLVLPLGGGIPHNTDDSLEALFDEELTTESSVDGLVLPKTQLRSPTSTDTSGDVPPSKSDKTAKSTKKKKATATKSKSKKRKSQDDDDNTDEPKRPRRPAPNNAFNQPMRLSPVLSDLVGGDLLPRTEVVKRIWKYIKEHNLQDESDRRYICCDDKLRAVFETDRVHMFTMNKHLANGHLKSTKGETETAA